MSFTVEEPLIEYMLEKIEWLIPFYIQLFIQEIDNIYIEDQPRKISKKLIDQAFNEMLDHRNHFDHWQKRLRKHFKKNKYKFTEDLLNHIARKKSVHSNEIVNLAAKHNVQEDFKEVINALIYDGYINNNEDPEVYRFNSPILRTWWYKNVTN